MKCWDKNNEKVECTNEVITVGTKSQSDAVNQYSVAKVKLVILRNRATIVHKVQKLRDTIISTILCILPTHASHCALACKSTLAMTKYGVSLFDEMSAEN